MKKAIIAGAIHGFLAVALGAFGAHALEDILDDYSAGIWDTAIQYQMFHAVGLILIGILMRVLGESKQLVWASRLMHAGIYFFAGSLLVLALTGIGVLGAITPIGGVLFLAGWALIVVATVKSST
ncbi:MAG: DUF423 domain-containing protein [Caryophanon sp.]|nr:DUF423 domain-containing protein [Caryophanon sp.]